MKKATLRATASAFALLGAGIGTAAMVAAPAAAQDYTSAALSGVVTDEGGAVVPGATVQLVSLDLGFTRTATAGNNGGFRFSSIPPGNYDLVVSREGTEVYRAESLRLLASQTANVDVVVPGGAVGEGEAIVIQGSQLINDFEGTTLGLNVDISELVKTVPVGRDLTSVVLIAPGTTKGDSAFGNLASIGGSSVAENAYYLNGLNITNFDNYLGSATVPFDMYRSVEVKSGGYPAEFGRATGGIVNTVTKSGSNDFFGGIHAYWEPEWLRSDGTNTQNCNQVEGVCYNNSDEEFDRADSITVAIEAGGPVIRDKLFLYGIVEFRERDFVTATTVNQDLSGSIQATRNDDPFWGVKVDAYPVESQHLEFTVFDTRSQSEYTFYDYAQVDGMGALGSETGRAVGNFGGVNFVGKWTGNFTDWLTLSAAYGEMRDRFDSYAVGQGSDQPYVRNFSGDTADGVADGGYGTSQRVSTVTLPYETEREFYRGDADIFFNLFGDHHVRAGFDVENNNLTRTTIANGGQYLFDNGYITGAAFNAGAGGGGALWYIDPAWDYDATSGDPIEQVVTITYYNSGGSFDAQNKAFYIQDEWNVTDRLTLNMGLRRDDFRVYRPDGDVLVDLKENYAPRLGFTYDLWPDKTGKLYGFYGQYYLPVASNTAYRSVGSEFYFDEQFEFGGFDSRGLPILGDQITDNPDYVNSCPFAITPSSSGGNCQVTGDGVPPPSDALFAANLKATKETEWLVGYEHDFGNIQVGISYINRRLNITAEDGAIDAAVNAYCDANGIDCTTESGIYDIWSGFHQYTIWNPGEDLVVTLDGGSRCADDARLCEEVTLTADQLGYPAAVRKYDAVELTFDYPFDGKFAFGGSYTWSKSRGNTEGYVQSDYGQDDAGITIDFDQPGFTDGAYGYLPNDRRHRFKIYGSVAPVEGLILGANINLQSPRKLSCYGYHPTDPYANLYGQRSHFCGGELFPRATGLETDWAFDVNAKVAYTVDFGDDRAVTLRADIFNVFNKQYVTERYEIGDYNRTLVQRIRYGLPTSYNAPRSVRLGMDIVF